MKVLILGGPGSPDVVLCPEVSYVDDLALFISHERPNKFCDRMYSQVARSRGTAISASCCRRVAVSHQR